ncbi:MAG: DUF58 domain-containing protein [Candidatus Kapaibacterium sp.]
MKSLYLTNRFFYALGSLVLLFTLCYALEVLLPIAKTAAAVMCLLVGAELFALYRTKQGIHAARRTPDKLSNGDDNPIIIAIDNHYGFPAYLTIIDELPFQFQVRDSLYEVRLAAGEHRAWQYLLRPTKRGEYNFGAVNVYASSVVGLLRRRYRFDNNAVAVVYPSYVQLRKYELLAISNRLTDAGIKQIRRVGQSMEFEHIRQYVRGDDYRLVNWKASARRGDLMVNNYTDEKAQQVYSVIDKGRVMKMPFEGMSLLDYAINSSLIISNVALLKQDKAGIITFSHKIGSVLPAERTTAQMHTILELLYAEKTGYTESNYELLHATLRQRVPQRSLILLYTNFETLSSLMRQLPYLRSIARRHLLVVIFFENTELRHRLEAPATTTEEIYLKTIAEKFAYEKRLIVKELERFGIQSILTPPENLTVNTINKYLELKARRMI